MDGASQATRLSPTLELARQRVAVARDAPPAPRDAPPAPRRAEAGRAIAATLAIAISWLAAGALVIGLAWIAATLERGAQIPADTLPYALVWSGASMAALATSVASLFVSSRRVALLGAAALLMLTLAATVAVQV